LCLGVLDARFHSADILAVGASPDRGKSSRVQRITEMSSLGGQLCGAQRWEWEWLRVLLRGFFFGDVSSDDLIGFGVTIPSNRGCAQPETDL
jgi:hypothetical protein